MALVRVHVPAASEPLHWRNRPLVAGSPVANKLGRRMELCARGSAPIIRTIFDEQAIMVSDSPALVSMHGDVVISRWPLSASLIQKLPGPFAPLGRSAPRGSPQAWW